MQIVDSPPPAPPWGKTLLGPPCIKGGHPGLQSQNRKVKGWGLGPLPVCSLLLSARAGYLPSPGPIYTNRDNAAPISWIRCEDQRGAPHQVLTRVCPCAQKLSVNAQPLFRSVKRV